MKLFHKLNFSTIGTLTTRSIRGFLLLGLLSMTAAFLPSAAQAQDRSIIIGLNSIRVTDEDDPTSNDEPYLIVTKFRMQVRVNADGRSVSIVPGTLRVANVMSGHNNLGRRNDNWADEVRTYPFPIGIPRFVQEIVPWGQPGWVVGAVVAHMEEDGFADSTANDLARLIQSAIRRAITTMTFTTPDARTFTAPLVRKIVSDLSRSARSLDIGGVIRGLASAVDPDDFGGIQVVLTVTGPGNTVSMFAGPPPATLEAALSSITEVTSVSSFSMDFPSGDLRAVPGNARFKGHHFVNGDVKIGRLDPPF